MQSKRSSFVLSHRALARIPRKAVRAFSKSFSKNKIAKKSIAKAEGYALFVNICLQILSFTLNTVAIFEDKSHCTPKDSSRDPPRKQLLRKKASAPAKNKDQPGTGEVRSPR